MGVASVFDAEAELRNCFYCAVYYQWSKKHNQTTVPYNSILPGVVYFEIDASLRYKIVYLALVLPVFFFDGFFDGENVQIIVACLKNGVKIQQMIC